MVKNCQTGLLKLNFQTRPKKRIFRFLPKISAGHGWSWKNFFCQFPNPWALRVSGMGGYTSKCEKMSKSLHPNEETVYLFFLHKKAAQKHTEILILFLNLQKIFISWHSPFKGRNFSMRPRSGEILCMPHGAISLSCVTHTHDKATGWESHKAVIRALAGDS
jgi:hypothetical protein